MSIMITQFDIFDYMQIEESVNLERICMYNRSIGYKFFVYFYLRGMNKATEMNHRLEQRINIRLQHAGSLLLLSYAMEKFYIRNNMKFP